MLVYQSLGLVRHTYSKGRFPRCKGDVFSPLNPTLKSPQLDRWVVFRQGKIHLQPSAGPLLKRQKKTAPRIKRTHPVQNKPVVTLGSISKPSKGTTLPSIIIGG